MDYPLQPPTEIKISETVNEISPPSLPNTPNSAPPKPKKNFKALLPVLIVAIALPAVTAAVYTAQTIRSKASDYGCNIIWKVDINPGKIDTTIAGGPINMSTIAYDANNAPIYRGVTYDWGMSSTNGIGTLNPNNNLATFTPLRNGYGDLYVKAINECTSTAVVKAIAVTVGGTNQVTPTPTYQLYSPTPSRGATPIPRTPTPTYRIYTPTPSRPTTPTPTYIIPTPPYRITPTPTYQITTTPRPTNRTTPTPTRRITPRPTIYYPKPTPPIRPPTRWYEPIFNAITRIFRRE